MIKIKKFNGENLAVTIKEELPDNYVKIQVLAPKESFFFNKEIVISRKSLEKHRTKAAAEVHSEALLSFTKKELI